MGNQMNIFIELVQVDFLVFILERLKIMHPPPPLQLIAALKILRRSLGTF